MLFNFDESKKVKILTDTKAQLETELYVILVRLGYDPDAFDVASWEPSEVVTSGEDHRMRKIIESLAIIATKLESFS